MRPWETLIGKRLFCMSGICRQSCKATSYKPHRMKTICIGLMREHFELTCKVGPIL
jgi:hypothetical protein